MYNQLLNELHQIGGRSQLCILGSAMLDIRVTTPYLPLSGDDISLSNQSMHLGGCAFNIILALKRLTVEAYAALPIGNGVWANETLKLLAHYDIYPHLHHQHLDNGWCMALVEPSGERTFLTIEGAETHWTSEILEQIQIPSDAILYVSGYQLFSDTGEEMIQWLENMHHPFKLIIDFGPRINLLTKQKLNRLLKLQPLLTLNRKETRHLAQIEGQTALLEKNTASFARYWYQQYNLPLVLRSDAQGAFIQDHLTAQHIPALTTRIKDTIGAGDAHTAGLLAGLAAGWSLKKSTVLGNAIASYVVAHEGADCAPNKQQLKQWLNTAEAAY